MITRVLIALAFTLTLQPWPAGAGTSSDSARREAIAAFFKDVHQDLIEMSQTYKELDGIVNTEIEFEEYSYMYWFELNFSNGFRSSAKKLFEFSSPESCVVSVRVTDTGSSHPQENYHLPYGPVHYPTLGIEYMQIVAVAPSNSSAKFIEHKINLSLSSRFEILRKTLLKK